jgi:hypothetical protein
MKKTLLLLAVLVGTALNAQTNIWPRTFSSQFVRTDPEKIMTDANGNVYYAANMFSDSQAPVNVKSYQDPNFIVPYWNESSQSGFNPALYSQPTFSYSQLFKFDPNGNMVWHRPLDFLSFNYKFRKTTTNIFMYKDNVNVTGQWQKEVIDFNNVTVMSTYTHTYGKFQSLDQNGNELYLKNTGVNAFQVNILNPVSNALVSSTNFNFVPPPPSDPTVSPIYYGVELRFITANQYLLSGYYFDTMSATITNAFTIIKSGSTFVIPSSSATPTLSYPNRGNDKLDFLFFNSRLYLGKFIERLYETPVTASPPVDNFVKVYSYTGSAFSPGPVYMFTGDYVYSMEVNAALNKIVYVGFRKVYEGTSAGGFAPAGIMAFNDRHTGKIATYDAGGNILLAGKYWNSTTLQLPSGVTQTVVPYSGYVHNVNPFTSIINQAGHHYVTKIKPSSSGYVFYKPGTLGVDEFALEESVKLYPNPATNVVNLDLNTIDSGKYEIYNVLGSQVAKGEISGNSLQIDISAYTSGSYFVKIYGANGKSATQQFVKQ